MMIFEYLLRVVVIIFSITVRGAARAYVACLRGDNTAKISGCITLNPIVHIELFRSIILPAILIFIKAPIIFCLEKSVPIDYKKLKNSKLDILLISLAGPASSLLLVFFSGLVIRLLKVFPDFTASFGSIRDCFLTMIVINVSFLIINMIPIPPLDGSKIAAYFLPAELMRKYLSLDPYISIMLLCFVLFSSATKYIVSLTINFFMMIFAGETGWTF